MELFEYVSFLKNLRGVIFFDKNDFPLREINWLKKKYRYRDLGIGENFFNSLKKKEKEKLEGFKILSLPFGRKKENLEIEAIKLASAYVSPLILIRKKTFDLFKKLKIVEEEIKIKEKLDDKEMKRNLRLVSYSIIDFYREAIRLSKDAKKRKKLIEKDKKRFWRLKDDRKGKTLIFYLEPLKILNQKERSIYLSLIPGIILEI